MKTWISKAVLYQVNLRALSVRDPRNPIEAARERPPKQSPLQYLARHLTRICRLGVNTLYLMPPYPIGRTHRKGIGSPYAIRDFRNVDPEYGTLDDLLDVLRAARRRNMRTILDITPNHTARDHLWMTTHPNYYVRDDDGSAAYDFDWSDTAKLDYRNPALRRAMIDTLAFWLGCLGKDADGNPQGVDGFRLDMAHLINDTSFWTEATSELRQRHPDRELLFLAESYGRARNLELFAHGINAAYDDDFYKILVYGYAWRRDTNGSPLRPVVHLSPQANHNPDFTALRDAFVDGGIAAAFQAAIEAYDTAPAGALLARYTDNHDEGRGLYRFGEGPVRAVMRLIFLSEKTIPFLLAGQEFGAMNRPPIHERIGLCDKGRRILEGNTERWTDGIEFEGNLFARGTTARREWYAFYRELITLRNRHRTLRDGETRFFDPGENAPKPARSVLAFDRTLPRRRIRCAVNLGPEPRRLDRAGLDGHPLYGSFENRTLPPYSAYITRSP